MRRSRGFTLLEVVIVAIALTLLAGAVASSVGVALRSQKQRDTAQQLDTLAASIRAYFQDMKAAPRLDLSGDPYIASRLGLRSLLTRDPNQDGSNDTPGGWRGPYIDPGVFSGIGNAVPSVAYRYDAWGSEIFYRWKPGDGTYTYSPQALDGRPHPLAVELISPGEDRILQTTPTGAVAGDDIVRTVNLTDLDQQWRTDQTISRLRVINGAAEVWRAANRSQGPQHPTIDELYASNLLVTDSLGRKSYSADAWGAAWTFGPDPTYFFTSPNVR